MCALRKRWKFYGALLLAEELKRGGLGEGGLFVTTKGWPHFRDQNDGFGPPPAVVYVDWIKTINKKLRKHNQNRNQDNGRHCTPHPDIGCRPIGGKTLYLRGPPT